MRQQQTDSHGDVILLGAFEKNLAIGKHHLSPHTGEAVDAKIYEQLNNRHKELSLELRSVTDELMVMEAKMRVLQTGSNYRSGFDNLKELLSESKIK